jgi:SAM-dependent methyltransferase|eukprot:COSAG02_NODE_3497_length_6651_cov_14.115655_6_plen_184_part_00
MLPQLMGRCVQTLLDIGCGEGHVLVLAAKHTGCQCIGLDIDRTLLSTARQAAVAAGVDDRCTWLCCDFRSAEAVDVLAKASAICIFMVPSALRLLVPTLAAHMRARGRTKVAPATVHVMGTGSEQPKGGECKPALRVATMVYHFEDCAASCGLVKSEEDSTWKLRMYECTCDGKEPAQETMNK